VLWHNKTTVKKGDVGESIVDAFLMSKNVVPYRPVFYGAHPFDRLLATPDKKSLFLADVKTKARRNYYPDTGIDIKHYNDYLFIQNKYHIKAFIFFVDESVLKIYGGWLSEISKPTAIVHNGKHIDYPLIQNGIIYFPVDLMQDISEITEEKATELKQLSQRNYEYLEASL